jgi:hypothetical protein
MSFEQGFSLGSAYCGEPLGEGWTADSLSAAR